MDERTIIGVYATFEDFFGRKSSLEELVDDVKQFSQSSILWVCAMIVTGLQLWDRFDHQDPGVYNTFISYFFNGPILLRLAAGYWSEPRTVLFHRGQVLLLAKLALLHRDGQGIDARSNLRLFARLLLKANDQFHYDLLAKLSGRPVGTRDDYARIVAEMLAVVEYTSPNIPHLFARSHLMLGRFVNELREDPDFVDVSAEHAKSTGLTSTEFEALIFGVHARFGEELAAKLFSDPGVLPLKDANFSETAVSPQKVRAFIDSIAGNATNMAVELAKTDHGPNDFTVFRKFPLIQQYYNLHLTSAWCGFLMLDGLFFLEKIQTSPYWNASALHGLRFRKFWGAVFEGYVNELMTGACAGSRAVFVSDPRPVDKPDIQICDGLVIAGDSLVLIEYKSCMFRADTKYSGNYVALTDEIEKKLVYDKEARQRKGVLQLAEAVKLCFSSDSTVSIAGVDLKAVKNLYLCIVTLDSIGANIGMSPLLNTFLEERLDRSAYAPIDVRPVFCLDIATLEATTALFGALTLPEILEKWYSTNPSLTTPLLAAVNLDRVAWKENSWLQTEWQEVYKQIIRILFPNKDPEESLAEGKRRAARRKR